MSSHFAVVVTLALAIFFSPETLVLGLVVANDRKRPLLAALAYAAGGVAGIAFATAVGLWIAATFDVEPGNGGSWPGFVVRALIAAVLLVIGLTRAVNTLRDKPIPDIAESGPTPGRIRTALAERFPKLARELRPDAELSIGQRVTRAAAAGFAMCGLHPKVFPIAIAAGHQVTEITDTAQRGLAVVVFAMIAVLPALLPAVIEVVRPGSLDRIRLGYERVMQAHGRWITAALLIGSAAFVGYSAWEKFPLRSS